VCGPTAHEIDDTWDADWLAARVACAADGAELTVPRIVLTSWSIRRFLEGLLALEHSLAGCAFLAAEGPQLALCATGDPRTGHITVRVDVTPDCAMQGHWFRFDVDQTFLAGLIDECRGILTAYPTHEME